MKGMSIIAMAIMHSAAAMAPTITSICGKTATDDPYVPRARSKGEKARNRKYRK